MLVHHPFFLHGNDAFAAGAGGALLRPLGWITRGMLIVFAVCLISPDINTDFVGLAGIIAVIVFRYIKFKYAAIAQVPEHRGG
ncbi:MAG: hypothetical protein JJ855_19790 [Rhodospirillales bacterium]|nr:hypothetical protein [Rhodospirillales bacterium]